MRKELFLLELLQELPHSVSNVKFKLKAYPPIRVSFVTANLSNTGCISISAIKIGEGELNVLEDAL